MLLFIVLIVPPVFLATSIYLVVVWRLTIRGRQHAGRCPSCDYDLAGLEQNAPCPECGKIGTRQHRPHSDRSCTSDVPSYRQFTTLILLPAPLVLPFVVRAGAGPVRYVTGFSLYEDLPFEFTGLVGLMVLYGTGMLLHCLLIELVARRRAAPHHSVRFTLFRAIGVAAVSAVVWGFTAWGIILPFWLVT